MLQAGARMVGGCCGTTPEHIKEIRKEARSLQHSVKPARQSSAPAVEVPAERPAALPEVPAALKSKLGAKLAAGTFVSFVEILPPRGIDASKEIDGARLCKAAGIDCINVPDGPRASARLSAQVTCQLIQQQAEIEAVLHVCCRDRNTLSIQSELLGAHLP
jgi:homocysteine S-methyltransferase